MSEAAAVLEVVPPARVLCILYAFDLEPAAKSVVLDWKGKAYQRVGDLWYAVGEEFGCSWASLLGHPRASATVVYVSAAGS